jgi:glutamate carboxypeptidase
MSRPLSADTVRRLAELVEVETPSGDADQLMRCYERVQAWGNPVLGRGGEIRTVDRVPHLYWPAQSHPSVLMLCHADTVFPVGTTAVRPFTVNDHRATGPGVLDMKAGIVIAIAALERAVDPTRCALLVTGDEESGSLTSRVLLEGAARESAATLVLEPSLNGALKTARKGGGIYELHLTGRAAHAGLEPHRGHNALSELARVVTTIEAMADHERGTTVTPTTATAGTTRNTVPARASLGIDVRAWTLAELERIDRQLKTLATSDQGVRVRVEGGVNRPPLEASSSAGLMATVRQVAAALGLPEPAEAAVGGASDGNFCAALGIPTLDGLGAAGAGLHADDEWVDLRSIRPQAALVAGIIDQLTATKAVVA